MSIKQMLEQRIQAIPSNIELLHIMDRWVLQGLFDHMVEDSPEALVHAFWELVRNRPSYFLPPSECYLPVVVSLLHESGHSPFARSFLAAHELAQ